jgi:LacI family transcriptional regulator
MATIQEVAAHAGVSVGSVSRYLNGHQLKPTNMEKIATAIKTLNYQENFLARGLKNKQTRSIGLLMNHVQNQFSATFIATVSDELEKLGYSIVVSALRDDASRLKEKLDFLMARQIDGLLLFEIEPTTLDQQYIKALTIPVASINIPLSLDNVDSIVMDNRQSTQAVIEKIIAYGHQHIGIIAAPQQDIIAKERLTGIQEAVNKHPHVTATIYFGDYSKASGYQNMQQLLTQDVSAVFVCNYKMALGALQALYESDQQIGTDISFASFDYFDLIEIVYPKLTVLRQPIKEISQLAAKRIIERIQAKEPLTATTYVCNNDILWRDSIANFLEDENK